MPSWAAMIRRTEFRGVRRPTEPRREVVPNLRYEVRGCIPSDVLRKKTSEGEGAYSPTEAERPHLPLRGKLGWMTPRNRLETAGRDAPPLFCLPEIDLSYTLLSPSLIAA